jgi:hypothetical protein
MPIFGRKNKGTRKKYQNKALTNAQAREIERVGGSNPTGGASTTADTKKAEGSKQTRNETAADYRAKKKAELDAKKRALVAKQKAVTADKANKKPVAPDHSKKTNKPYKGVTSDDKKSQAKIEAGNKRAIANRTAKGKAKKGDKYKYTKADGSTVMITKK